MRERNGLLNIFLAGILIWSLGCRRTSNQKIESAQKELDESIREQAERYAPADYLAAKDTLQRARGENDRGNRNEAVRLAEEAERRAKAAVDAADKNKRVMKNSVKQTINDTRKTIDQAKQEYKNARNLQVPEANLAAPNSALTSAETDLKQAEQILDSGDILVAREKAATAQSKVIEALQQIRDLVATRAASHKR